MWYETMVEIDHADEPFECFDIDWLGVILDGLDLGRKWSNSVLINPVAEETDFIHTELALFELDD